MSVVFVAGLLSHYTRNKCSNIRWGQNQIKAITTMIKMNFLFRFLPFVAWHDCSDQVQGCIFYNFEFVTSVKDVKGSMLCFPFFVIKKSNIRWIWNSFVWKSSCRINTTWPEEIILVYFCPQSFLMELFGNCMENVVPKMIAFKKGTVK